MTITELRNKINTLNLHSKFNGLVSYGISTKIVNGVDTGELCVRFSVEKKTDINSLSANIDQIIPSNLIDYNIDIITDVVQTQKKCILSIQQEYNSKEAIANYREFIANNDLGDMRHLSEEEINNIPDDYTSHTNRLWVDYYNNPSNVTSEPLKYNRKKYRPLKGGVSSIELGSSDATMGLIVRDATDNSIVALSNNHVYASSQLCGAYASEGEHLNTLGLSARQPSSPYYGNIEGSDTPANDCIGIHKRCVAIIDNQFKGTYNDNTVDCAIVQLSGYDNLINSQSTEVIGFKFKGPHTFATTAEIDSLMDSSSPNYKAPIFRSGRTLGPIGYPGSEWSRDYPYSDGTLHKTFKPLILPVEIGMPDKIEYIAGVQNYSQTSIFDFSRNGVASNGSVLLIYKGNDIYYSGTRGYLASIAGTKQFVPARVFAAPFSKIGTFSYFELINENWNNTWGNMGSIGLSGGRLVYYGLRDSYSFSSGYWPDEYRPFPYTLPSYEGLKTILTVNDSFFLLKNKELYSIGKNSDRDTLGFGVLGDVYDQSWNRIPGEWDGIYQHAHGIAALSGGQLFVTFPDNALITEAYRYFTNRFDLSANNLNYDHYIKKVFTGGFYNHQRWWFNAGYGSGLWYLTDTNRLIEPIYDDNNANDGVIDKRYRDYGTWGDDIQVVPTFNNTPTFMLLSGSNLYTAGMSVKSPYYNTSGLGRGENYIPSSNFFANSWPYGSEDFHIVPGVNVQSIGGWASLHERSGRSDLPNEKYRQKLQGESLVFLSAGEWYYTGSNIDGVFGYDGSTTDNVIVSEIGALIEIQYSNTKGRNVFVADNIVIKSREGVFPTAQGGDSGSAVFALLSANIPTLSAWKCIGLLYAGDVTMTTESGGIVCRIDNIVDKLKIKAWDGTIPTTKSTIQNVVYNSAINTIPTITLSGRQYFNIGLT
jgi:hypothetical protein